MDHGREFWQNMVRWRREWLTPSVFLPWEPHEQYEKAKRYDNRRWDPQLVGVQYTTGEGWRNSSRKNKEAESKQKQHPVVDVTGDGSKVWCYKEQYYQEWNRLPAQVGCMRWVLRTGALGRPKGMGWRGRWEGGSGWGTHVNPWLIHVNVWQKTITML